MIYPCLNDYTHVALKEAMRIEPLRDLLDKGAAAIPSSPQDPYVDPLTDTERSLLNTSLELAERVGQVYDYALQKIASAALNLCDTVERYTNGAALRSELLNTVTQTRPKKR